MSPSLSFAFRARSLGSRPPFGKVTVPTLSHTSHIRLYAATSVAGNSTSGTGGSKPRAGSGAFKPRAGSRRSPSMEQDSLVPKHEFVGRRYDAPPGPSEFPEWAFEPRDFFSFEVLHQSSKSGARVGRIHTPHGVIDTPSYVAVATNAALKGVSFRDADAAGQQLVFSNTYHLMVHPGPDKVAEAGGIHKFTNRQNRPFITDSGGFQIFSLAHGSVQRDLASKGELKRTATKGDGQQDNYKSAESLKVTEEGVSFRSYRDGSNILLTPESTVQAQKKIGADIIIPLDELPSYYTHHVRLMQAVERTHRWEARSLKEHLKDVKQQAMFCVIHGGIDPELRRKSVDYLTSLPFDGYAIGGSLGNGREELKNLLSWLMPMMNEGDRPKKPRHLLGIADEESIRNGVLEGIDTFDSAFPTKYVLCIDDNQKALAPYSFALPLLLY